MTKQIFSDKILKKLSECRKGTLNHFYGKHHSEETKKLLSQINKGKIIKDETKRKISESQKGRKLSDETKRKIGLSNKGKKRSKEFGIKMMLLHTGKKFSVETNPNYGMRNKKHSEESKKNMSKLRKRLFKEGKLKGCFQKGDIPITKGKTKENYLPLKIMSKKMTSKNNPAWNNGSSFEPYGQNWTEKFKRTIRKRDNQICMLCSIHREKLKKTLFIHHINYDKNLSVPQNCISLCNSCHSKTNINRKHWVNFFQPLLNEKYNYKYENNKVVINIK